MGDLLRLKFSSSPESNVTNRRAKRATARPTAPMSRTQPTTVTAAERTALATSCMTVYAAERAKLVTR